MGAFGDMFEGGKQYVSKIADILSRSASSGAEMYGSASKPAPPEVVKGVLGFTPGIGDAISVYDAYDAAKQGNYGEAALNAVGVIPGIPSLGSAVKGAAVLAAPAATIGVLNKIADARGVNISTSRLAEALNNQSGAIKANNSTIKSLPITPDAYSVLSNGSLGHNILYGGDVVGTIVAGKQKHAVGTFLEELESAKTAIADEVRRQSGQRKINAAERARIAQSSMVTNAAMREHAELVNNAHKNTDLRFTPIDNAAFSDKSAVNVYQSPSYGNKPGSSYKVIDVNGEPAYARQSDHWGRFSTKEYDQYGDEVWKYHNWQLPNAEKTGDRYTGYILLRDLMSIK